MQLTIMLGRMGYLDNTPWSLAGKLTNVHNIAYHVFQISTTGFVGEGGRHVIERQSVAPEHKLRIKRIGRQYTQNRTARRGVVPLFL